LGKNKIQNGNGSTEENKKIIKHDEFSKATKNNIIGEMDLADIYVVFHTMIAHSSQKTMEFSRK
jgi:uncharacterized protein YjcR